MPSIQYLHELYFINLIGNETLVAQKKDGETK